jgi:hypothetical protein
MNKHPSEFAFEPLMLKPPDEILVRQIDPNSVETEVAIPTRDNILSRVVIHPQYVSSIRVRVNQLHEHDKRLYPPGTELSLSSEIASFLLQRGAVEFINKELEENPT